MASPPLLESLRNLVTPDLVSRSASQFGEPESVTSKALAAALPALLAGLVAKADEPSFQQRLLDLLSNPALDSSTLANPASLLDATQPGKSSPLSQLATQLLTAVFGTQSRGVSDEIARASGARPTAAGAILSLAAPLVLGVLAKRTRNEGLDASGLAKLLLGEKSAVLAAAPAGIAALLGGDARRRATLAAGRPIPGAAAETRRWLWGLALLVGAFALWALLGDREAPSVATRQEPGPVAAAPPAGADLVQRTLPDGAQLSMPRGGLEDSLIASIGDTSRPPDEGAWIDFDRLLFAPGSATLEASSRSQLRNVAAILVAYPSLRVEVGAYTDDTGDDAANLALSRERAANVRSELIALGVPEGRLEAEGYGEQHPLASNATEQGRAKNPRISLRIVER